MTFLLFVIRQPT